MTATLLEGPVVVADTTMLTRPQWLDARRAGIGGSDVAAIAGLDSYRSPFAVYLDKTTVDPAADEDSEPAEWGRRLEPYVADRLAHDEGLTLVEHPFLLRHPVHEFALANVDRLAVADPIKLSPSFTTGSPVAVVECKTANAWHDGWKEDDAPDRAVLQLNHYLLVTGLQVGYLACLIGGQRFRSWRIERDDELLEHMVRIEGDFWQRVQDRNPPAPDWRDKDLLAHLYDVKPEAVVDLDDQGEHVLTLLEERRLQKAVIKNATRVVDGVEAELKALIGEHEVAQLAGRPVFTWKQSERAGFTVAPSTVRTFRVSKGNSHG